jgi:hypothetical protein
MARKYLERSIHSLNGIMGAPNVVQAPDHQQGEAGVRGSKHQAPNPPQQEKQQPQQQQQRQQQHQVDSTAEQVLEALLYHPRLDKNLVYRYLPIFARLSDKTRDIDGKFILKLAAEPSGAGLKTFLGTALQHQP